MTSAAVIQMTSSADPHENLQTAYQLLQQAARRGAQLAVLPENFTLMGMSEQDNFAIAEHDNDGPVQTWLANTARQLGLWIVAGTMPLKIPGESRVAAACLVVNAQGERVARYDKIHLYDVDVDDATGSYRESNTIAPGHRPVLIDTPVGRLGLAICYDVRFPELFRQLSALDQEAGAEVLVLPAAFTVPTGRAHWDVLLRARAIENLCYLLAAGQTGLHANGRETYGHSMIVDSWGEVLATLGTEVGVQVATIDLGKQREQRRKFPVLAHRRL
ncbi:MAG: carbon-nitrogen hydrolase family protein [Steroidobacteraceae bacterium]